MTLNQISYIIKISELGSMNKAAEKLFISQPTLTNAVKELENELGIHIFKRNGKGTVPTPEGEDFLVYARQLYQQFELLKEKYIDHTKIKRKFKVSSQHYSFAVKAFVETVKQYDMEKYEFAFREEKTREVIDDVSNFRSEIGVLYINRFNEKVIKKLLRDRNLELKNLIECKAFVYIWKNHPLARKDSISFSDLNDYPCLSFEQGETDSFYLSEEILSTNEYPKIIKATDRSTMLNLMVGLNGYTLCSGIICKELNGSDFIAVPYHSDEKNPNPQMHIGYIVKKDMPLSSIGEKYITELKKYLSSHT